MKGLLLAACLALLSNGVHANENCHDTPLKFCSKTFQAYMKCHDAEGLAQIHGNHCPAGQTCSYCPTGRNCPLIQPWEKVPIKIVGVEMIVTAGNITWAFAGNASVPDVMAKISEREGRVQQWFPTGLGFSMPPQGTPGSNHIDLHIACPTSWWRKRSAHMLYTIYYVMLQPEPETMPSG
jgi:hypothetical protein